MPTLADLRNRFLPAPGFSKEIEEQDEVLVVDARGNMSPAQIVEIKLRTALHGPTLVRAGLVTARGKRRASK